MAGKQVRAVVVGASSPLGKELADQLNDTGSTLWDLSLVDAGEGGRMTAAADEAMVISGLTPASFSGAEIVFFAGEPSLTRAHWKEAQAAGASVVDLTGALEREAGAVVLAPGVGPARPDLATTVVVAAHPAAVMLATVLKAVHAGAGQAVSAATVLVPASQWGEVAIEELQRQTVSLLSFQAVAREFFDAQTAFSVLGGFGAAAKADIRLEEQTVRRHLHMLSPDAKCAVQLLQAPVFHGYGASVWVASGANATEESLANALKAAGLEVANDQATEVSNAGAAGQGTILARLREDTDGVWLWLAADNLHVAARNGLACADALLRLRPSGTLQ